MIFVEALFLQKIVPVSLGYVLLIVYTPWNRPVALRHVGTENPSRGIIWPIDSETGEV